MPTCGKLQFCLITSTYCELGYPVNNSGDSKLPWRTPNVNNEQSAYPSDNSNTITKTKPGKHHTDKISVHFLSTYQLKSVRQGSVFSPILLELHIDDISNSVTLFQGLSYVCRLSNQLCADDTLSISPSVLMLEYLLHPCEIELKNTDMAINFKKSSCLRTGPCYDATCTCVRRRHYFMGHSDSVFGYLYSQFKSVWVLTASC